MKSRRQKLWDAARSSYWFLPTVLILLSVGLAFVMTTIDRRLPVPWKNLLGGTSESAVQNQRTLLATLAGSMITVASLVFSIAVVALTLAAQEFGPRLIYTFKADRVSQAVLGIFTGTFMYCLLVLRIAYTSDTGEVVAPQVSTIVALLLAFASIILLVYFIHHITEMIQAPALISRVGGQANRMVEQTFPLERPSDRAPAGEDHSPADQFPAVQSICTRRDGILQAVDTSALVALGQKHDALVIVKARAGQFMVRQSEMAVLRRRSERERDRSGDQAARQVISAFVFGYRRTLIQDVEFALNQLVEIALRALSPGINDDFTAIHCIDQLGAAMALVARRPDVSPYFIDGDGQVRLIMPVPSFQHLLSAAFDQIRQSGRDHVAIVIRLLESFGRLAEQTTQDHQREAVLRQAEMVVDAAREQGFVRGDQEDIDQRYQALRTAAAQQPPR